MANTQHIYTDYGDPISNGVTPSGESHHYLDSQNGDMWMYGPHGWVCIYRAGSEGNIAFYDAVTGSAPSHPDHPAIRWFGGKLSFYINGDWREITLAPNT